MHETSKSRRLASTAWTSLREDLGVDFGRIASRSDTCLVNKSPKQPNLKPMNMSASQSLELLYTDVIGPIRPASLRHNNYTVKNMDHYTSSSARRIRSWKKRWRSFFENPRFPVVCVYKIFVSTEGKNKLLAISKNTASQQPSLSVYRALHAQTKWDEGARRMQLLYHALPHEE